MQLTPSTQAHIFFPLRLLDVRKQFKLFWFDAKNRDEVLTLQIPFLAHLVYLMQGPTAQRIKRMYSMSWVRLSCTAQHTLAIHSFYVEWLGAETCSDSSVKSLHILDRGQLYTMKG